jgi:hypothetical protein
MTSSDASRDASSDETFEKLNQYLYKKFNEVNDSQKGDIIELLKKHYSSVNHSYTEKLRELFAYFISHNTANHNICTTDTVLTKDAFFNMYITTKLREIYYFDEEYEENLAKPRCSLSSFNVFKCYYKECYDAKEQKRLYNTFITELKGLMESEAHEAHEVNLGKPGKPGKPTKKKKAISATVKRLVWNTNIGEDIGKAKCMCCKTTDITQLSFHCGHIFAEANGGDTIVSNLKPICQNCNSSMGTKNMNDFMESLK